MTATAPAGRPAPAAPAPSSRGRIDRLATGALGYVGHQVHVVRRREATWLLEALGDVRGRTVVDVAGGDGYWAGRLRRAGATAVALDLDTGKLARGRRLPRPPHLVRGDALALPFPDARADGVLSICALEHLPDAGQALAETARVLRPGGVLALSADALTAEMRWPALSAGHRRRYAVHDTFAAGELADLLDTAGFDVVRTAHMFRETWCQGVYLRLHRWRWAPNALAPLGPLVARSDARSAGPGGAVVLVQARRR